MAECVVRTPPAVTGARQDYEVENQPSDGSRVLAATKTRSVWPG